jgi:DNA-binding transcriptional LysR family regulator
MRGSEFAELRAFLAVTDEGNFSRAAAKLRMSPSTLSQTIRKLETRLGIQLLSRTTRSVSITEAGRHLLARFKPAFDEMQAAVDDARKFGATPAGTVRVLLAHPAFTTLIEPLLGRFNETNPDIVLDLTIDDAPDDIVAAGFDVGFRLGELLEEDMIAVPVGGEIRQIAFASPEYVARHGAPRTPAELHDHYCINWRWAGTKGVYSWEFAHNGKWFSVAVNGPLIVSHRHAALSAALQGVGIAFWNEKLVRPLINEGRLVPLLEKFSPHFPGWHMTYSRQRHMPLAVRTFVDFIRKTIPNTKRSRGRATRDRVTGS